MFTAMESAYHLLRRIPVIRTRVLGPAVPALAVSVMIAALGLVACSGTAPMSSGGSLPATAQKSSVPEFTAKPSPTPYSFNFETVNKPGADSNHVTGINQLGQITGYYGTGSKSDPAVGYKSAPPYSKFQPVRYPGAINTYPMGISDDFLDSGYFLSNTTGNHTFGFVKEHGLYTLYKDFKTPKGPNTVNELLGINDSDVAVGFYTDLSGNNHAYELFATEGKFVNLDPPGFSSTVGAGITNQGNVAGFGVTSKGATEGWIYLNGVYRTLSYPGSTSTEALGINWEDQVAGEYTSKDGTTHGFVVTKANTNQPIWQAIDEPDAAGVTVINSINHHHAIAGWYVDSTGDTDGFVATLK